MFNFGEWYLQILSKKNIEPNFLIHFYKGRVELWFAEKPCFWYGIRMDTFWQLAAKNTLRKLIPFREIRDLGQIGTRDISFQEIFVLGRKQTGTLYEP